MFWVKNTVKYFYLEAPVLNRTMKFLGILVQCIIITCCILVTC